MSNCFLVETEKSTLSQDRGVFTLAFWDRNFNINKIELTKLLVKLGLKVKKIRVSKTFIKTKKKGAKKYATTQFRPKKYFVYLSPGQQINQDLITKINETI